MGEKINIQVEDSSVEVSQGDPIFKHGKFCPYNRP
jgi:hypothetical protein